MKYLVMECRPGYAVLLDEEGRFLKAANRNYQVGQTVIEVVEMRLASSAPGRKWMRRGLLYAGVAACLAVMTVSALRIARMPYASIYMTINPEVRIDVNRKDMAVGLYGVNEDGEDLIEGYDYKKKSVDLVMDELVDRAIQMGYLHEGGTISLSFDTDSEEWVVSKGEEVRQQLNEHLKEKLSVTIWITDPENQGSQVVIPMEPEEYGESDYGQATETPASPTVQPLPFATPAVTALQGDSGYEDADEEGETDYGQPVGTPAVTEPPAPVEEGSDYGEPEEQEEQEEREEQEEQEEGGDSDYGDGEEEDDD